MQNVFNEISGKVFDIINNKDNQENLLILRMKVLKNINVLNKLPIENYKALSESPKTTNWIMVVLIPNILNGQKGFYKLLNNIELEKNIFIRAVKFNIVCEFLYNFDEDINELEFLAINNYEMVLRNISLFNEKREFKQLH